MTSQEAALALQKLLSCPVFEHLMTSAIKMSEIDANEAFKWLHEVGQAAPPPSRPEVLATEVNALPPRIKNYIMWLETEADPAGTIRENWRLSQENAALRVAIAEPEALRPVTTETSGREGAAPPVPDASETSGRDAIAAQIAEVLQQRARRYITQARLALGDRAPEVDDLLAKAIKTLPAPPPVTSLRPREPLWYDSGHCVKHVRRDCVVCGYETNPAKPWTGLLTDAADFVESNHAVYPHVRVQDQAMSFIKALAAALREQRDTPPRKILTVGIDPNSVESPSSVRVPTDGSSVPRCDYPNCAGSAWRCFHCRAEFDTDAEAEVHFGKTEVFTTPTPVCQLTLARVRQLDALAEEVAQTLDDCEERDPEFVITKDHYDNLCAAIEGLESARDASGSSDA